MKEKIKQTFIESLPILIGIIITGLFWDNNVLLAAIYAVFIAGILKLKYVKGEIFVFIYGVVIGLIVEVVGTSVSGYQSFTNPYFAGIPLWLPLVWGYGLLLMGRIHRIWTK